MTNSDSPASVGPQPGALSVTVDNDGDLATVTVSGEIDLETSADLGAVLAGLDGDGDVRLDLGEVSYIDSTGLRVLLTARDAAAAGGGKSASVGDVEHRCQAHRDHRVGRTARELNLTFSHRGS